MNTNYEILNYLNLTNSRLGKLYKLTGYNPLPDDFVFDNEAIKERLYLNQMMEFVSLPNIVFAEKKAIKNCMKNSLKNIKKIEKIVFEEENNFNKKILSYLDIRKEITKFILKDFKKYDFDEREAFEEIYGLDPVLGQLFEKIFDENISVENLLENLEERYNLSYQEKIQFVEKKNAQKNKETEAHLQEFVSRKIQEKSTQIVEEKAKKQEKSAKTAKKIENKSKNQEIVPTNTKNKER